MLEGARERFAEAGQQATFIQAPWQDVEARVDGRFDLVICHAVLEWLAEPKAILPVLHRLTAADGWLSLAFYNRDALIYRNLLKGHFKKLRAQSFAGERQRPEQPLDPRELATQLALVVAGRTQQRRARVPRLHAARIPGAYRAGRAAGNGAGLPAPPRPSPVSGATCTGCAGRTDGEEGIHGTLVRTPHPLPADVGPERLPVLQPLHQRSRTDPG
ncbi:tRNA 5-carboxymethoxyuridine methyltransferase [Stutzerimonas stutzeri]